METITFNFDCRCRCKSEFNKPIHSIKSLCPLDTSYFNTNDKRIVTYMYM